MVRDYDLLGKIQYYVKLTSPALSILSSVKIQFLGGSPRYLLYTPKLGRVSAVAVRYVC